MSDLISRKALLQQLRIDEALGFDDFYETVDNFPTADKIYEDVGNSIDKAIEIVKGAVKE